MTNTTSNRLLSLDALRGFDMFWIIGGGAFFGVLGRQTEWAWADSMAKQMEHVSWAGFHLMDLVFPLFMFIAGVAIPYALLGKLEKGVTKRALYQKVFKRALILVILGVVYNGVLDFNFSGQRYASVLGQIGLAYLIAAIIAINARSFKVIGLSVLGILIGYGLLQLFVPVPGFGPGDLTPEGSVNGFIDRLFLPGKLYGTTFDPEGILCILSASAITLMGTLAGLILRSTQYTQYKKVGIIALVGAGSLIAALILQPWYPVIKSAWTSTFNLMAGGISFLLLALFYLVVDVWKWQKWIFFFRIIGLNSITIYLAVHFINFKYTSDKVFGGVASLFGDFEPIMLVVALITLEWLFLYFLFKRNLFMRV